MAAAAFIAALRKEYIEGAGAAVGDYFDRYGGNPHYDTLEERVRNADDKAAVIAEIEKEICGEAAVTAVTKKKAKAAAAKKRGTRQRTTKRASGGGDRGQTKSSPPQGAGNPSAFVVALRAEYVEGKSGAVGVYFDTYGSVPEYEALEERVQNSGNKEAEIAKIQHEVSGMPPGQTPSSPPQKAGNPSAFVSALRAEYVEGKSGAVGNYLDTHGSHPEFEALEERVQNSGNKAAEIAKIQDEVSGTPPGQTPSSLPQKAGNPSAFVSALRAEYVEGKSGAVGDYFDTYGSIPEHEALEERVQNSGNKAAMVSEIQNEICGPSPVRASCKPPQHTDYAPENVGTTAPGNSSQPQSGDFNFKEWCANNGCMSRMVQDAADKQVRKDMEEHGANPTLDAECRQYEYSLICGKCESSNSKVEIEDTETKEARERGIARLKSFKTPILVVGCCLQTMIVLAMILTLATVDCETGTSTSQLLVTVAAVLCMFALMLGAIEHLLRLQSNTALEGVPLVRFMITTGCFGNPRIVTLLVCNAVYGKIAGASFIGNVIMCSTKQDDSLFDNTLNSLAHAWSTGERGDNETPGLSIVAAIFFVLPLCIQFARVYRSVQSINLAFSNFKYQPEEGPEAHLGVSICIDDLSSISDWALLTPVAQVFDKAALPLVLADENDAARVWDLLRTRAYAEAANLFPDAIVKFWLCCINFVLVANTKSLLDRLQLGLLAASSAVTALLAGIRLLRRSFCLTVLIGLMIILCILLPTIYAFATLGCGQNKFGTITFACLAMKG
eukprot:TRINITY_DN11690_c0_g1_i1.p1 TRINITY_DN11690_c0_g1~~TRINITY_DN11690_c0_g1_i1.p1  ORF type:complete len:783 (+),score=131.07 TRINITY_DN11690_c0_g1_i1:47-2395(+)